MTNNAMIRYASAHIGYIGIQIIAVTAANDAATIPTQRPIEEPCETAIPANTRIAPIPNQAHAQREPCSEIIRVWLTISHCSLFLKPKAHIPSTIRINPATIKTIDENVIQPVPLLFTVDLQYSIEPCEQGAPSRRDRRTALSISGGYTKNHLLSLPR